MSYTDPNINKFVGTGLLFPIKLDSYGKALLGTGWEILESDLQVLIGWPEGTRFFMGEYGTKLAEFIEEPNDKILENLLRVHLIDQIKKWEPRLEVLEVNLQRRNDVSVNIIMKVRVRTTKLDKTFVVPYYIVLNP